MFLKGLKSLNQPANVVPAQMMPLNTSIAPVDRTAEIPNGRRPGDSVVDLSLRVSIWLDAQHRLLAAQTLFRGTLTQIGIFPREFVKAALIHNAVAVIFAHKHPSGS